MPRRHKPVKHSPLRMINNESRKKRFPNKLAAERAAGQQMLLHPQLELKVYQGDDGGWYLTRQQERF